MNASLNRPALGSTRPTLTGVARTFFLLAATLLLPSALFGGQSAAKDNVFTETFYTGHGVFYYQNGNIFVPNRAFILKSQQGYIRFLEQKEPTSNIKSAEQIQNKLMAKQTIFSAVKERIIANALYVDWLVASVGKSSVRRIAVLNNALRGHYLQKNRDNPTTNTVDKKLKGIDAATAGQLQRAGYFFPVSAHSTSDYISSCRDSGVPVPAAVFSTSDGWQNLGAYSPKVSNIQGDGPVWVRYDDNPAGSCIAVPFVDGRRAHVDMICLGSQSSKACFFEKNVTGDLGTVSTSSMNGAFSDQVSGRCSDCHAGKNPFIVHPDSPPFAALDRTKTMPLEWYTPLAPSDWPQPKPTDLLSAVSSIGKCTDCHNPFIAGRLPQLSTDHPGYCEHVLPPVTTANSGTLTMPANGAIYPDINHYLPHVNALLAMCARPPNQEPKIVDFSAPDDSSFVSKPTVRQPIYGCADDSANSSADVVAGDTPGGSNDANVKQIKVSGALLGSTVHLFINDQEKGVRINVRDPDNIDFVAKVAIGDVIKASQQSNGVSSMLSSPVTVKDVLIDFPEQLTAPRIDPTLVYECAKLVQVSHVPGAKVTLRVNGTNPFSFKTSSGTTVAPAGNAPFVVGDEIIATASMCGRSSPPSLMVRAIQAPATITSPFVNSPLPFDGQELLSFGNLTNGARTKIELANDSTEIGFSWPTSSRSNVDIASTIGRPLIASDRWVIQHQLCEKTTSSEPLRGTARCSDLPPPRLEQPYAGNNYVIVTESVPGSRVRIYDADVRELGDSSGTLIQLNRALVSADTVTAVQQVGSCTSKQGYRVSVQ